MKKLLGDHPITIRCFDGLDAILKKLKALKGPDRKKSGVVNRTLLELIQKEKEPCFLLPAVLQFVRLADEAKILQHYVFTSFEIWLNQASGLDFEENYRVRAKIAGKWIARSDYQNLFPIGMGKVYEGTHFVTAHKSPDLDTTIASFWGWIDAFAARVSDGLHIWNLPGGAPPSQIEIEWMFKDIFGEKVFDHLPKTRLALGVTGNDLMARIGMQCKTLDDSIAQIDHDRDANAVVVVDEEGFYLGDWRATDVEGVRQVILLISSCIRWFENTLQIKLIHLFSKKTLHIGEVAPALDDFLRTRLSKCEPASEFSSRQMRQIDDFLKKVLKMAKGVESDFEELALHLCRMSDVKYGGADNLSLKMEKAGLFDKKGLLKDDRPEIFAFLKSSFEALHKGILQVRARLDKLDIALQTKFDVFGRTPTVVTTRSDVEEILSKMTHRSHLTVVYPDAKGMFPVGVIQASDLRRNTLGTVSLRDFCNREEMGIPPYLEVISVIDHHKTTLSTMAPPMAVISDVQSSNTLVAQKAFEINDLYTSHESKTIDKQISLHAKKSSSASTRLMQRLLQRRLAASKKEGYYIHPEREYIEYLHFLYGIIDDTDLLSKVSALDVECVAELLNRLKSLSLGEETEIIDFDGLRRDRDFPKKAAQRILQNEEMYSLYSRVYRYREKEVEKNIALCASGEPSNFFADTKEQNGCCRVGQTKIFSANISAFERHVRELRHVWLQKAMKVHKEKPEVDLHIHMISTIVDAEEVYKGVSGKYSHLDEMWIWAADNEMGLEHLRRFLIAFQRSPGVKNNSFSVEFLGAKALAQVFKESFMEVPQTTGQGSGILVLRYKAGTLNSRKAMISPFLPTAALPR